MPRHRLPLLASILVLAVSNAAAQSPRRFTGGPVTIADQGSFFIGGETKFSELASIPGAPPGQQPPAPTPQQITIGQMYVQFQIPAKIKGPGWPVIMVHGSSHTGAALESTPDGREGWYPYFVRKGVATYVVDQAGRGRSGFDQSVLHEARAKALAGDAAGAAALLPNFGRISDTQAWTFWFGHLLPAGSTIASGRLIKHGDPGDPQLGTGTKPHVAPLFPLESAGEYYKQLVPNGEVTLPGSTCATCTPQNVSPANTWTPRALALLVERLGGAVIATHSQSGNMGHHMVRILKERGHLDLVKGLITIEGGCSLPQSGLAAADFDRIPYLVVKGDYANASTQCQETHRRDQQAARGEAGRREGRVLEARRSRHAGRHAHDDARREEPRDRGPDARVGGEARREGAAPAVTQNRSSPPYPGCRNGDSGAGLRR
jgi:hypothetical protein